MRLWKYNKDEAGYLLILSMVVVVALSIVLLVLAQTVASQYATNKKYVYVENATTAAEAGVSATIAQLNLSPSFSGFSTDQSFYSSSSQGNATYSTTVTTSGQNRIIVSTGKAYRTTDTSQLADTKKIRVVAAIKKDRNTNTLIVGSGGLYMAQGSGIPSGDLYIRGQLQMEQSAFIGSSSQSVNVDIANVGCGNSTNWPQPCGASSEPIKMVNSTPGSIYGSVCATNQVTSSFIYPGPTGTGLSSNCISRVTSAPTFDKQTFTQNVSSTTSSYSCPAFGGTVTIPDGARISGDLNLSTFLNLFGCTVYIAGNVYITGALNISPNVTLQVADGVGTKRPTIVADTGANFLVGVGSSNLFLPNSIGTTMFIISFASVKVSCSTDDNTPNATTQTCLSPGDAQTSALPVPYPGGGTATVNGTGAMLYAYYSNISLSSNVTAQFYALGAQGLYLGSNTKITTSATNAPFADVLSFPTYQPVDYQQVYN